MGTSVISRSIAGVLILIVVFFVIVWTQLRSIENSLEDELAHALRNLRLVLTSIMSEAPARYDHSAFLHVLAASDVRGLEIFSGDGRRVWSAGEPLELIAYQLDRETALTHRSGEGSRFEIFWPASHLAAEYGLAARLDISWQNCLRREMQRSVVIGSAAIAVTVLIVSLTLFRSTGLPSRCGARVSRKRACAPRDGAHADQS